MFRRLFLFFYSETAQDTTIVLLGTFINVIAGGLFFVFAPRILGPSDYGLFSTVISTALISAAIANFGLDSGILRFGKKDSGNFNMILSLALKSYLIFGFLNAVVGLLVAPFVAGFLGQPQITILLQIAFAGTFFILLTNFFVAGLQARQEFLKASIVNISSNLARIIILAIAFYFFTVDLYFLTTLFFFITIVSIIFGKYLLPFKIQKPDKNSVVSYFKYNSWIAAALVISSIPIENYFLLKIAGPIQTGLYAAPFKILTFAHQFGGNFTRVLASRFSSFDTSGKSKEFAVKSLIFPLIFSIGLILLMIISKPVVQVVLGEEFLNAVPVMQILSLGFIFFFFSTIPSSIILYYFGRSDITFYITISRFITFVALLILTVPRLNAVGGAIAFSVSEAFSLLLMSAYVLIKFQKHE